MISHFDTREHNGVMTKMASAEKYRLLNPRRLLAPCFYLWPDLFYGRDREGMERNNTTSIRWLDWIFKTLRRIDFERITVINESR